MFVDFPSKAFGVFWGFRMFSEASGGPRRLPGGSPEAPGPPKHFPKRPNTSTRIIPSIRLREAGLWPICRVPCGGAGRGPPKRFPKRPDTSTGTVPSTLEGRGQDSASSLRAAPHLPADPSAARPGASGPPLSGPSAPAEVVEHRRRIDGDDESRRGPAGSRRRRREPAKDRGAPGPGSRLPGGRDPKRRPPRVEASARGRTRGRARGRAQLFG